MPRKSGSTGLTRAQITQQLKDWLHALLILEYDRAIAENEGKVRIWIREHTDSNGVHVPAHQEEVPTVGIRGSYGQRGDTFSLSRTHAPVEESAYSYSNHLSPCRRTAAIAQKIRQRYPSVAPYKMYGVPDVVDHPPGPAERAWAEEKVAEFNIAPSFGYYKVSLKAEEVTVIGTIKVPANGISDAIDQALKQPQLVPWRPKEGSPSQHKIKVTDCVKDH